MPVRSSSRGGSAWGVEDLFRWVLFVGAGLTMVLVAWFSASGEARFGSEQIQMLDLAVAGLVLTCVGHVLWVSIGRRAVGERRRLLLGEGTLLGIRADGAGVVAGARVVDEGDTLVAGLGTRLFHRATCTLADGRGWPPKSRDEHLLADRVPCGVCRP